MSPFLFILAADILSKIIKNARKNNVVSGMARNCAEEGIQLMEYADDTVISVAANKVIDLKGPFR